MSIKTPSNRHFPMLTNTTNMLTTKRIQYLIKGKKDKTTRLNHDITYNSNPKKMDKITLETLYHNPQNHNCSS